MAVGQKPQQKKPNRPAAAAGDGGQFIRVTPPGRGKGSQGQLLAPQIDTSPIWTPEHMQQQINAQRAYTDMSTANRINEMQTSAAGRGFGSQSPILAALQGQYQAAGLASNVENERLSRMQGAQENARHRLDAQTAREREITGRMTGRNTILQALAGLV